jgi:hypothetical protein
MSVYWDTERSYAKVVRPKDDGTSQLWAGCDPYDETVDDDPGNHLGHDKVEEVPNRRARRCREEWSGEVGGSRPINK